MTAGVYVGYQVVFRNLQSAERKERLTCTL